MKTPWAAVSGGCFGAAMALLGCLGRASAQGFPVTTCDPWGGLVAGSYVIAADYWNQASCPGTQCVAIDSASGDFTVISGDFNCGQDVASYPSANFGCQWGGCSPGTNLPLPISSLRCVTSSWSFTPTRTGYWDAAYDLWFYPTYDTSAGPTGGGELMIWLDYAPGTVAGMTTAFSHIPINGNTWDISIGGTPNWTYTAYLANQSVTVFTNEDLLAFIQDSLARGYLQNTWYLSAVDAGNEFRTAGVPFTSRGFSVSVNPPTCGTHTATPTASPTATPAASGTPTAQPGEGADILWPNPWDGSRPLVFIHEVAVPADSVRLKLYTLSFRKIHDSGPLPGTVGRRTFGLSWREAGNLANGVYYLVLSEDRGRTTAKTIMKLLVRR